MNKPMISRNCPICGSDSHSREFAAARYDADRLNEFAFASRKLPEYMHYRLLLCGQCELLYASPVPQSESLVEEYEAAAYDSGVEAQFAARTYASLLPPILARLPGRAGALDIGAGDGAFLKELLALGFTELAGAEPSSAPIAAADEVIRPMLHHAPFRVEDFRGRQFQLITCFQTMEHVPDPLQVCRDARTLLAEGGAMMCVVHNRLALSARLLGRRSPIYDIEHLQLFSRPSVRRLMETAGFSDVHTAVIVNRYPLSYWLRLFPLPAAIKKPILTAAGKSAFGRITVALPAGNLAVWGFKKNLHANGAA